MRRVSWPSLRSRTGRQGTSGNSRTLNDDLIYGLIIESVLYRAKTFPPGRRDRPCGPSPRNARNQSRDRKSTWRNRMTAVGGIAGDRLPGSRQPPPHRAARPATWHRWRAGNVRKSHSSRPDASHGSRQSRPRRGARAKPCGWRRQRDLLVVSDDGWQAGGWPCNPIKPL